MAKTQLRNGNIKRKPSHGTRRQDVLDGRPGRRGQSTHIPDGRKRARAARLAPVTSPPADGTWPLVMDPITDTPDAAPTSAVDPTIPIEELDLTVRAYNPLKGEGVNTLGELVARTKADLLDIRNFGQKGLDEVKDKLRGKFGLYLKGDDPAAG